VAITFEVPKLKGFTKKQTADWLKIVAEKEGAQIERLYYKSFKRQEMIELNTQFLGHEYDTDIISFSIHEHPMPIDADFAIGWDQINEQASELNQPLLKGYIGYWSTDSCIVLDMTIKLRMIDKRSEAKKICT